jgi:hypothetical protein
MLTHTHTAFLQGRKQSGRRRMCKKWRAKQKQRLSAELIVKDQNPCMHNLAKGPALQLH